LEGFEPSTDINLVNENVASATAFLFAAAGKETLAPTTPVSVVGPWNSAGRRPHSVTAHKDEQREDASHDAIGHQRQFERTLSTFEHSAA
jgi:hypothetical protein